MRGAVQGRVGQRKIRGWAWPSPRAVHRAACKHARAEFGALKEGGGKSCGVYAGDEVRMATASRGVVNTHARAFHGAASPFNNGTNGSIPSPALRDSIVPEMSTNAPLARAGRDCRRTPSAYHLSQRPTLFDCDRLTVRVQARSHQLVSDHFHASALSIEEWY
jgi:hypothetical protein